MATGGILVAAMVGHAAAAVVVHDNSEGEFKWWSGIHYTDHTEKDGTFLDITQPPSQTGERRPGTIGKWWRPNSSTSNPAIRQFAGESGVETPQTDQGVFLWWNDQWIKPRITREFLPGELITAEANWEHTSNYFYHLPFSGSFLEGTPAISTLAYIGVRTKISDRWHYGWILFANYMTPLKWAYETEPDVPIQVPVPTPGVGLIALVGGSCIMHRRRWRRACSFHRGDGRVFVYRRDDLTRHPVLSARAGVEGLSMKYAMQVVAIAALASDALAAGGPRSSADPMCHRCSALRTSVAWFLALVLRLRPCIAHLLHPRDGSPEFALGVLSDGSMHTWDQIATKCCRARRPAPA